MRKNARPLRAMRELKKALAQERRRDDETNWLPVTIERTNPLESCG